MTTVTTTTPTTVVPSTPTLVPVSDRKFSMVVPFVPTKSKQRNVVLGILSASKTPMTIAQIAELWKANHSAVKVVDNRIADSVRYHLHCTGLLKITKYV